MLPKLQINLLGDFSLRSKNQLVTGVNTKRCQVNSHAPQPRQRIVSGRIPLVKTDAGTL
jgi:hypothetical protein